MADVGPPLDPFGPGAQSIGTPPFNWRQTILSQYSASPILLALAQSISEWFDATTPIDNFFDMVWNIDTAIGWGLDVWGRIVGVGRALTVHPRYLGFDEGGTLDYDTFGHGIWYTPGGSTTNFLLSDDAYRQLILAKAFANICDGTIPQINRVLNLLFGGNGACYVQDNGDMTMTYVFLFDLTPVDRAIVTQSGVLPRPTGVSVSYTIA